MTDATALAERPRQAAAVPAAGSEHRHWFSGYGGGAEMPLGSYSLLVGLYNTAVAALLIAAHRTGRLPERIPARDLLLLGVATFRLSRLITKDWVTSPLRAPFAQYQGPEGEGEVNERARGTGMQRALGDLI